MDVAVLCALRVTEDGADRTPRGQRSRDLLAALLLRRGQAVEASVLLDLVWGSGSGLMPTVVHTQMARLRRDIGGDQRAEVRGRLPADRRSRWTWTSFTDLLARARGSGQPEATVTCCGRPSHCGEATARTPTSPRSSSRRRSPGSCSAPARAARALLAERLLDQGDREAVEEAAGLAELLVGQDPTRERGHELAILAAARAGRRAEALEPVRPAPQDAARRAGHRPGPDAQELHLQVLRDELAPVPAARRPAATRTSPPAPTSRIHGREDDLAQVLALLGERRLISIVGLGGVGKSRLLFELAAVLGAER